MSLNPVGGFRYDFISYEGDLRGFIGMTIVLDLWGKESDEALSALAVLIVLSSVSEYGRRVFSEPPKVILEEEKNHPWKRQRCLWEIIFYYRAESLEKLNQS